MKIEHLFIASLILIGTVFITGLLWAMINKRRAKKDVAGYQLKKGHLHFHIAYVKKYPHFTVAFFPLVDVAPLTSLIKNQQQRAQFKGIACLLEVNGLNQELLDKLSLHFDRLEQDDEQFLTFYKEEFNFMDNKMKQFVALIDKEIEEHALKVLSSPDPQ